MTLRFSASFAATAQAWTLDNDVKKRSEKESVLLAEVVAVEIIEPGGTMTSADGGGVASYVTRHICSHGQIGVEF